METEDLLQLADAGWLWPDTVECDIHGTVENLHGDKHNPRCGYCAMEDWIDRAFGGGAVDG